MGLEKISSKNLELLMYILRQRPSSGVTELMKLCYLIDLTSIKEEGKQISDFNYVRYTYGPFDEKIYLCLRRLVGERNVIERSSYTISGNEHITYELNVELSGSKKISLTKKEIFIIDEVLDVMRGHGAKALTDVAYKTKPMQKLGATIGGDENLNIALDLMV